MGNPSNKNRKKSSSSSANHDGAGGEEPLHWAARSGDVHAVQSICTSNPLAVNSRDKHSRTPLHLAAWAGHTEVVTYLCKNKADVAAAAMDDMGAVHFAAQKGHLEVVRSLLSSGVSVKACNRKGLTPLHFAVQGSHIELIKYLVRKGSSLTAKTKAGKTPLDFASSEEIRSCLIELEESSKKRNDQNAKEKNEETTDPKPSMEDKPLGSGGNDQNMKENNEKTDLKPSNEDKPLGSAREAVAKHDEKQDEEMDNIKRKGDETEIKENLSKPKKAKIALNHLLAADDTQEENF